MFSLNKIKAVGSLVMGLVLLTSCGAEEPTVLNIPIPTTKMLSDLDSITHTKGTDQWRTLFSFDDQGRLTKIQGTGVYENWSREFLYDGDRLSQVILQLIHGSQSRDSLVYNSDNLIVEVYHYSKPYNREETLSSIEARRYDRFEQLSESLWTRDGQPSGLLNRSTYHWADGNLIKQFYYDGDLLQFGYDFEYDAQPFLGSYIHFGIEPPAGQVTANNVTSQTRTDYNPNAAFDGVCTPCLQEMMYDENGVLSTTNTLFQSNTNYQATYHY